jgi:hypothetical protein
MFHRGSLSMLLRLIWLPIFLAACAPGAAPPPGAQPSYGGNYSSPAATATQSPAQLSPTYPIYATPLSSALQADSTLESAPQQELVQAINQLSTTYPIRLTETTTLSGQTTRRVAEYAAPNRAHVTITNGQGSPQSETIRIGSNLYTQQAGQWTVSTATSQNASELDLTELLSLGLTNVKLVGPESVNGVDTQAYTFDLKIPFGTEAYPGTGEIWIGNADGLPYQVEYQGEVQGNQLITTLKYEYGVDLQIEAPVP